MGSVITSSNVKVNCIYKQKSNLKTKDLQRPMMQQAEINNHSNMDHNKKICALFGYTFDDFMRVEDESLRDSSASRRNVLIIAKGLFERQQHIRIDPDNIWLSAYEDTAFYKLYRMKRATFYELLNILLQADEFNSIRPAYHGGNEPVEDRKKLLVFLWYMATSDTLQSIADKFHLVPSTVMKIVNDFLYIVNNPLRIKYIVWPQTLGEFESISSEFDYPGVVGAIDGTHIKLKVEKAQEDSYIDRYQNHSINVMAICTKSKIFTNVFCGFPGSAHDSRVFDSSLMARHIEQYGPRKYFPRRDLHLLGDKAFPLKEWMMVPYRETPQITRQQLYHNYLLSKNRVCIEHAFGLVKGRWRRTCFINTYTISKGVEIANAAFVLHNFCYSSLDEWDEPFFDEERNRNIYIDNNRDRVLGERKRDNICQRINTGRN